MQADLKTFHHFKVFGTSVVTLLTVQNTLRVSDVRLLEVDFVADQLDAVLEDVPPAAAKTGALGSADLVRLIAARAADFRFPLVVDPVMISKHGARLIDDEAVSAITKHLVPIANWITPNRHEAAQIMGFEVDGIESMRRAAKGIADHGAKHVLIKGGRIDGKSIDILYFDGEFHHLEGDWIDTTDTHGTGCVLSAAITANLALGCNALQAATLAKWFVTRALRVSPKIGKGIGPINFFPGRSPARWEHSLIGTFTDRRAALSFR